VVQSRLAYAIGMPDNARSDAAVQSDRVETLGRDAVAIGTPDSVVGCVRVLEGVRASSRMATFIEMPVNGASDAAGAACA